MGDNFLVVIIVLRSFSGFFFFFIVPTAKQHFLAVADDVGMVRVFEIPKMHYSPSRKEVRQSKHLL